MVQKRKKKRTHVKEEDDPTATPVPKSFVIPTGKLTNSAKGLIQDIRRVLLPNTADKLKATRKNRLKDFIGVAGPLGVSHMILLSQTDVATNMRIAKLPKGPTLTFRILQYCLIKDIVASQAKPRSPGKEYATAPLLVLNNFNQPEQHVKLMATMFQNMFPSLNIEKIHASDCRRIVLINYDKDTKRISFRHYYINVKIVGVSKSLKRIIQTDIPDLHKFEDISEYVLKDAVISESDVEDAGDNNLITLPEKYVGRNNSKNQQRAVKLTELGPRIDMMLFKIQDGLCDGDVIYHEFLKLTPQQIAAKKQEAEKKAQLKAQRKKQQEENVKRKNNLNESLNTELEDAIEDAQVLSDQEEEFDQDDFDIDADSQVDEDMDAQQDNILGSEISEDEEEEE